jgi:CBS domain containing-hemolysin-like protein
VEADTPLSEVVETIVGRGHSRLPVYEETIDKILGIVYARDVLAALAWPEPGNTLRNLARPAFIVPETKRVDELLEEFQERHIQIAVVVDEYGGTDGLVTMEDVLEEIVGEIEDEFSRNREAHVIWQTDGTVLVDAGVTTDQIAEIFGAGIDSDDFDTVGGFVYHSLGRVPQAGDSVETDELHIEVASILGRRLRRLRIRRVDPTPASTKG